MIIKKLASKTYPQGPIFKYMTRKIMKLEFALIFFGKKRHIFGRFGLTSSKTANMLTGPYLFFKLNYDYREIRLETRSNIFPFPPF